MPQTQAVGRPARSPRKATTKTPVKKDAAPQVPSTKAAAKAYALQRVDALANGTISPNNVLFHMEEETTVTDAEQAS